jgi:alkanesulfonate monooxygenase SsuD/methylene tetrahydromethanopterin reductase-like flavin-dependent oxidoreductase (luciferase family)
MAPIAPTAQRLAGLGLILAAPAPRDAGDDVLDASTSAAQAAEAAGFTSVWVTETSAQPPEAVPYEAFSLLGALGARTGHVHLGAVADAGQRRAPSILAKIVTGVDVISHGRAVLAVDGDRSDPDDADRLSEALDVVRAVLEDDHPTVSGRIYSVTDAVNRPAPVQADGVPLVVFLHGAGPGGSVLDVCARSADAVVVTGGPDGVADVLVTLAGRDGRRDRPGDRVAVLGRVAAGEVSPAVLRDVRAAGADGCLVELAAPWSGERVARLGLAW